MTERPIRAHVGETVQSDPQEKIASFTMDSPATGLLRVHHASDISIGEIGSIGNARIMITIAQAGCKCGCEAPGRALMFTPTPEDARALAQQLIDTATRHEADALSAVTEALARARAR